MPRLLILDPSYATFTGHNHAVNSLLLEEATRRGIETTVFANVVLTQRDRVVPAFRPFAYGFFPRNSLDALQAAHAIGMKFGEDLARHVQPHLIKDTVVFAHTLNNPLLHGLAAWVASLPIPGDIAVRLGLNLPPDFRQPRQELALWNAYQYGYAFKLLTAVAPATRFYAETRELQSQFAGFVPRPVDCRRLPLPVMPEYANRTRSHDDDGRLVFYVPGEYRTEKGHQFLIDGILRIAEQNPAWLQRIRFRFTPIFLPEDVAATLARHGSLFEVIADKSIPLDRYWQLLAEADVVGCVYSPSDYAKRASGIFNEALAIGRPVVVSRNTSIAAEVANDGAAYGITVDFGDIDSLAKGLERLVETYPTLRQGAAAVSERFQRELSAAPLIDWLFDTERAGDAR